MYDYLIFLAKSQGKQTGRLVVFAHKENRLNLPENDVLFLL